MPSEPVSTRCSASRRAEGKLTEPSGWNGVTIAVRSSPSGAAMPGVYPRLCVNSPAVSATFRPSGVLVPLVTPFDDRGAVDFDALGALATRALDAGAAGVG